MKRFLLILCASLALLGSVHAQSTNFDPNTGFKDPNKGENEISTLKRMLRQLGGSTQTGEPSSLSVTQSNPTTTGFRNTAVSSTPVLVKASAGMVYGWNIINVNTSPVYLKVYDNAAPTVGTTAPTTVYAVPATGVFFLPRNGFPHGSFSTAISIACVTGLPDSSTTAPATAIYVQLAYQ